MGKHVECRILYTYGIIDIGLPYEHGGKHEASLAFATLQK